jgi:hypothetical protein
VLWNVFEFFLFEVAQTLCLLTVFESFQQVFFQISSDPRSSSSPGILMIQMLKVLFFTDP